MQKLKYINRLILIINIILVIIGCSSGAGIGGSSQNNTPEQYAAIIEIAAVNSGGFGSGNGTQVFPYQLTVNAIGTLIYTFTNYSNTTPATQFYLTFNVLPSGWSLSSNNCGTSNMPITLNTNDICTVSFVLNGLNIGAFNFDQQVCVANWVDAVNLGGIAKKTSSKITYVLVVG